MLLCVITGVLLYVGTHKRPESTLGPLELELKVVFSSLMSILNSDPREQNLLCVLFLSSPLNNDYVQIKFFTTNLLCIFLVYFWASLASKCLLQ